MATQRTAVALVGGFLLLLVAAAIFLFTWNTTEAPGDPGDLARSTATQPIADLASGAAESSPERETATATRIATVKTDRLFPPAYERALSGIVGRVVEPEGTGVANAEVELIGGLLEFITLDIDKLLFESDSYAVDITQQKQKTDKEGRFRFARVDPRGYYIIGINLGKGRPALRLVDHTPMPGESVDLGDVHLDPWLALTGRIIDEIGKPLAGVRVRATNLPAIAFQSGIANLQPGTGILVRMGEKNAPKLMWRLPHWTDQIFEKLPTPSTVSGPDGRFRLEGAPSGPLTLIMDAPYLPAGFKGPIPPAKGNEKDVDDVVVSRGQEVEGVVVDEQDKPVGDSEIIVGIPSPLAAEYIAFLRKPFKTGPDGRFVAKGVPGQKAYFLARGPGQADWTVDNPVELTGDDVKIKIPAPRSILVQVQDSTGKPVAAKIAVQRAVEGLSLFPQIETPLLVKPDAVSPGTYRVRGLKLGEFWVYARAEGYAIAKEKVKIDVGTEEPTVLLKCELEFSIATTVLGKENGKPIPLEAATVAGVPDKGGDKLGFMALGHAKTGENGVALVRALGEGKFHLVATHPAYALGTVEVEIPGAKTAEIQLLVGGTISGTVVRDGLPPEKPMMVVVAPRKDKTIQLPRTSITDLEGKFHFNHLYPGGYTVAAVPRLFNDNLTKLNPMEFMRFASENADQECTVADEQTTEMVIDLAKGGRKDTPDDGFIRGSAFVNGMAAEGDYIMASGPEWVRPKKVDASGAFDLGRARAGDYSLTLTRGGSGMGSGPFNGSLATKKVIVKATEASFVDINIRTGKLRGSVVDEGNKSIANARVRINAKGADNNPFGGGLNARSDDSGKFEIEEIASGTYRVSASLDDLISSTVDVAIADGATQKVEIQLKPGAEVDGIFDAKVPEGARWAWMQFQTKTPDGDSFGQNNPVDVDLEKKTFHARRLTPGSYKITMRIMGGEARTAYKSVDLDVPSGGLKGVSLKFEELSPEEAAKQLDNLPFGGGGRRRGR